MRVLNTQASLSGQFTPETQIQLCNTHNITAEDLNGINSIINYSNDDNVTNNSQTPDMTVVNQTSMTHFQSDMCQISVEQIQQNRSAEILQDTNTENGFVQHRTHNSVSNDDSSSSAITPAEHMSHTQNHNKESITAKDYRDKEQIEKGTKVDTSTNDDKSEDIEVIIPQIDNKDIVRYVYPLFSKHTRTVTTMTSKSLLQECVEQMAHDILKRKQEEMVSKDVQCEILN